MYNFMALCGIQTRLRVLMNFIKWMISDKYDSGI